MAEIGAKRTQVCCAAPELLSSGNPYPALHCRIVQNLTGSRL
ncbi:hypothetical protein NX02_06115 [Sphingomonas sanxanigenens DSM 19645 = NX02]|uniref:Uncharacterized protein n=1 Tax=Sphingomonas sanxanigenens DSM 19645 = NX02 TaxID=1123269 RepID=W0ABB4_9SPHN|nr:hypothetical protein NX02_06115 [Sphingomonas sanxanigenens DSM 19645 = NX02]